VCRPRKRINGSDLGDPPNPRQGSRITDIFYRDAPKSRGNVLSMDLCVAQSDPLIFRAVVAIRLFLFFQCVRGGPTKRSGGKTALIKFFRLGTVQFTDIAGVIDCRIGHQWVVENNLPSLLNRQRVFVMPSFERGDICRNLHQNGTLTAFSSSSKRARSAFHLSALARGCRGVSLTELLLVPGCNGRRNYGASLRKHERAIRI
jgi:hypothetical protein